MWPYSDDEARWLTPREGAEMAQHPSAGDNDQAHPAAQRTAPAAASEAPDQSQKLSPGR